MTTPGPGGHRFLVCRAHQAPVPWSPPVPTEATGQDVAYFGQALVCAAQLLGDGPPLTFVLTWDLDELPVTGPDVVAIVQGDEDARIPRWANDVRLTFKCYGVGPPWMPMLPRPGVLEALELAHYLRRVIRGLPGAATRAWASGRPWRRRPPIHPIPLGYYNQQAGPMIPFEQRRWSISFAGSGLVPVPGRGWRQRVSTPKDRSRAQMRRALAELARTRPQEPVTTVSLAAFPRLLPGADRDARALTAAYSDLLAQTRLCLVPRGNSPETFRYFEALRAGCVVVCETLPDHWFYRGAPTVTVRRWNQLGAILGELLDDPAALAQRHRASVSWWQSRCSEPALGKYMAERIRR